MLVMLSLSKSEVFSCNRDHAVVLRIAAGSPCVTNPDSFRHYLAHLSSGLPSWLLQALQEPSGTSRHNIPVFDKPDVQQQLQLESCLACIPHCPCTHQLAADAGFMCNNPPLPLQLSTLLGTADRFSLGTVSKALHCVVNDQATREEAAWWSVKLSHKFPSTDSFLSHKLTQVSTDHIQNRSSSSNAGSNHHQGGAFSSSSGSGGGGGGSSSSGSSGSSSDSGSGSGKICSLSDSLNIVTQTCRPSLYSNHAYSLKDKQRMRCLSLLLGSPEKAAEQLLSMDTKHRSCVTSSTVYPNDEYLKLMQHFANMGGGRVEVLEVDSDKPCTLYMVAAQHVFF